MVRLLKHWARRRQLADRATGCFAPKVLRKVSWCLLTMLQSQGKCLATVENQRRGSCKELCLKALATTYMLCCLGFTFPVAALIWTGGGFSTYTLVLMAVRVLQEDNSKLNPQSVQEPLRCRIASTFCIFAWSSCVYLCQSTSDVSETNCFPQRGSNNHDLPCKYHPKTATNGALIMLFMLMRKSKVEPACPFQNCLALSKMLDRCLLSTDSSKPLFHV